MINRLKQLLNDNGPCKAIRQVAIEFPAASVDEIIFAANMVGINASTARIQFRQARKLVAPQATPRKAKARKVPFVKRSIQYSSLNGDRNDCAVRALTLAGQISYDVAHATFARFGRVANRGSSLSTCWKSYETVAGKWHMTHGADRITLNQFIQDHPVGRFILHKSGHAFALINGVVHDWAYGTSKNTLLWLAYEVL